MTTENTPDASDAVSRAAAIRALLGVSLYIDSDSEQCTSSRARTTGEVREACLAAVRALPATPVAPSASASEEVARVLIDVRDAVSQPAQAIMSNADNALALAGLQGKEHPVADLLRNIERLAGDVVARVDRMIEEARRAAPVAANSSNSSNTSTPSPSAPAPAAACEHCEGSGRAGDAFLDNEHDCIVCGGTSKRKVPAPAAVAGVEVLLMRGEAALDEPLHSAPERWRALVADLAAGLRSTEAARVRAEAERDETDGESNMANGVLVMANEARPGESVADAIRRILNREAAERAAHAETRRHSEDKHRLLDSLASALEANGRDPLVAALRLREERDAARRDLEEVRAASEAVLDDCSLSNWMKLHSALRPVKQAEYVVVPKCFVHPGPLPRAGTPREDAPAEFPADFVEECALRVAERMWHHDSWAPWSNLTDKYQDASRDVARAVLSLALQRFAALARTEEAVDAATNAFHDADTESTEEAMVPTIDAILASIRERAGVAGEVVAPRPTRVGCPCEACEAGRDRAGEPDAATFSRFTRGDIFVNEECTVLDPDAVAAMGQAVAWLVRRAGGGR